jgi:hypothetical protein
LKTDYNPSDDRGFSLELLAILFLWVKQALRAYRAATAATEDH